MFKQCNYWELGSWLVSKYIKELNPLRTEHIKRSNTVRQFIDRGMFALSGQVFWLNGHG